ncbi:MAG: hypothetical protein R3A79_24340 [Nannocystaceae bacterium]
MIRAQLRACALASALALAAGCGGDAQTPEAAAKAFVEAVQRGDTGRILSMIDASSMSHLQAAAERATHHVGGRRTVAPHEMLQIVDVDPLLRVARVEVLDSDGEAARVRIHGSQDQSADLSLVLEDGAWRVKIPTPTSPTPGPRAPAPPVPPP